MRKTIEYFVIILVFQHVVASAQNDPVSLQNTLVYYTTNSAASFYPIAPAIKSMRIVEIEGLNVRDLESIEQVINSQGTIINVAKKMTKIPPLPVNDEEVYERVKELLRNLNYKYLLIISSDQENSNVNFKFVLSNPDDKNKRLGQRAIDLDPIKTTCVINSNDDNELRKRKITSAIRKLTPNLNLPPVAKLSILGKNNYKSFVSSDSIVLDGESSYDPDNTSVYLRYKWEISNLDTNQKEEKESDSSHFKYKPNKEGSYEITLKVFDDLAWSPPIRDTVEVIDTPVISVAKNKLSFTRVRNGTNIRQYSYSNVVSIDKDPEIHSLRIDHEIPESELLTSSMLSKKTLDSLLSHSVVSKNNHYSINSTLSDSFFIVGQLHSARMNTFTTYKGITSNTVPIDINFFRYGNLDITLLGSYGLFGGSKTVFGDDIPLKEDLIELESNLTLGNGLGLSLGLKIAEFRGFSSDSDLGFRKIGLYWKRHLPSWRNHYVKLQTQFRSSTYKSESKLHMDGFVEYGFYLFKPIVGRTIIPLGIVGRFSFPLPVDNNGTGFVSGQTYLSLGITSNFNVF